MIGAFIAPAAWCCPRCGLRSRSARKPINLQLPPLACRLDVIRWLPPRLLIRLGLRSGILRYRCIRCDHSEWRWARSVKEE